MSNVPDHATATRVLHLRNSDLLGGPEQLILGECAHAGAGLRPLIASFVTAGCTNPFLVEAERLGAEAVALEQRGSFDLRVIGRVRQLLAIVQPDVVVGHDYKANLILKRALGGFERTAPGSPIPRVAMVHGYTAENRKIRFFERVDRRHLREADAVVAVSGAMVARLRSCGVPQERLHVESNAIDVEGVASAAARGRASLRSAWGVGDGERLVLALGRLSPEKGHEVLLEAFAAACLRSPVPCRLVLVGDGAARAALEARAAQPDLAGRVVFAGWRADPWACLGAADLFVLPSHREGMPLALLEALAAGLPVVSTSVGSIPRVLEEGRYGTLVPPGAVPQLAEALQTELRRKPDPTAAERLRAHVRKGYSAASRARRLERLYTSLALGGVTC